MARERHEVFSAWSESMRAAGLTEATVKSRRATFAAWWAHTAGEPFEADHHAVERYLARRHLAPATSARHLSDLHRFYRWAQREGFASSDPTLLIEPRHLPRRVPRPAPDHVVRAAGLYVEDVRVRCAIALMAYAGLRCCEVAALTVGDIDHEAGRIFIRGKGSHERYVPITRRLRTVLGVLDGAPPAAPVFPSKLGPGHVTAGRVSTVVGDHLTGLAGGQRVSAHRLRHWFAGDVLARTGSLGTVKQLLGHASIATTEGYAVLAAVEADALEAGG